jgi:HD-GYP domain-containing protein (c-di-GMP phosphodiesterase class II)
VYDALISNRVYREAWSHERAMLLLEQQAGIAFDARCVAALAEVFTPPAEVVPIASARRLGIARTAPAA